MADERDGRYVEHPTPNLLRQRIYQIAAGCEDANDSTFLRHDPTLGAVVGRGELPLASQPTLSRLENAFGWESIRALERLGLEWFIRYEAALIYTDSKVFRFESPPILSTRIGLAIYAPAMNPMAGTLPRTGMLAEREPPVLRRLFKR